MKTIEEKTAWSTAMAKAEGVKVKDDVDLLKKSIKKIDQRKKKSKQKWEDRKESVEKRKDFKQKKRSENISKRKQDKKNNKRPRQGKETQYLKIFSGYIPEIFVFLSPDYCPFRLKNIILISKIK